MIAVGNFVNLRGGTLQTILGRSPFGCPQDTQQEKSVPQSTLVWLRAPLRFGCQIRRQCRRQTKRKLLKSSTCNIEEEILRASLYLTQPNSSNSNKTKLKDLDQSVAPNHGFLLNALKTLFKLSRVLLDLQKYIIVGAKKFISVRSSQGTQFFFEITRASKQYYFPENFRFLFSAKNSITWGSEMQKYTIVREWNGHLENSQPTSRYRKF